MRYLLALLLLFPAVAKAEDIQTAIFAGGCFWCVESDFDLVNGVVETTSGYTGGTMENPTYPNHGTHREAVLIRYDADVVSYEQLLNYFWRSIDPFDPNGQFCDKGNSYKSAIYAVNGTQEAAAKASKAALDGRFSQPIATEVLRTDKFWPAEGYHQDYYLKNPLKYKFYRSRCGRDRRVQQIWGDEAIDTSGHS
jgi:peptide-methionine (S)-S-oxide reductase